MCCCVAPLRASANRLLFKVSGFTGEGGDGEADTAADASRAAIINGLGIMLVVLCVSFLITSLVLGLVEMSGNIRREMAQRRHKGLGARSGSEEASTDAAEAVTSPRAEALRHVSTAMFNAIATRFRHPPSELGVARAADHGSGVANGWATASSPQDGATVQWMVNPAAAGRPGGRSAHGGGGGHNGAGSGSTHDGGVGVEMTAFGGRRAADSSEGVHAAGGSSGGDDVPGLAPPQPRLNSADAHHGPGSLPSGRVAVAPRARGRRGSLKAAATDAGDVKRRAAVSFKAARAAGRKAPRAGREATARALRAGAGGASLRPRAALSSAAVGASDRVGNPRDEAGAGSGPPTTATPLARVHNERAAARLARVTRLSAVGAVGPKETAE